MAPPTMLDVFAKAFLPIARSSGLEFIRGATRALVTPLGAACAIISERIDAARVQPLVAYSGDEYVEDIGVLAPEDLGTLEAHARRISSAPPDATWHCVEGSPYVAIGVLVRGPLVDPLQTSLVLVASRASAEIARMRSEERNRLVTTAIGDVIYEWTVGTDHVTWTENVQNVFGDALRSDTTVGEWLSRIHAADRERVDVSLREMLAGRDTRWTLEYRFVRADGGIALVRDRAIVVRAGDGRPLRMIGAVADITQTKTLEQRMIIAERTASMGTLAAGVAHEINNPLAYVKGNVEHVLHELQRHRDIEPDLLAALEEAREGAERVRRIVEDLRLFSRPQDAGGGPVDLERVVESALAIAKHDIAARARLETVFRHPPAVEAHEARIGQVMLNLLVNAIRSMPEGAADRNVLRVETGTDEAGRAFVSVADTGAGIPPEVVGRIFDPFFTTKPVGEGTGLGLSIAHSIVTAAGGEISVDSVPGAGSTFRVTLPAMRPSRP